MKEGRVSLLLMTVRAMWRRKWGNIVIVSMVTLGVCSALLLQPLADRQEASRAKVVETFDIRCVVTDAGGMHSDDLWMLSNFVNKLVGKEEGCSLHEYVDRVQALSVLPLASPQDFWIHRILNFASDESLGRLAGTEIELYDGWTEEVFQTEALVCLVPEELAADGRKTFAMMQNGTEPVELTIIGTVKGGASNVIYCPFYMREPGIAHFVFSTRSCSFSIRHNDRLEECKAAIYEHFIEPSLTAKKDGMTYGVLVQDEVYLETLGQIDENISLLRLLQPLLLMLSFCIGGVTSFLSTKGRAREFAVMRCLGMSPAKVFLVVFEEFLILAAAGAVVGFGAGYLLEGTPGGRAAAGALGIIVVYLIGAAAAVLRICNINVMRLMKGGDEA